MAESSKGYARSPSLSSSTTADGQEKITMEMNELSGDGPSRKSADLDFGKEEEQDTLLPVEDSKPAEPAKTSTATAVSWMIVNTLATIGIVCAFRWSTLKQSC
jgi:hypothetical protein